MKKILLLLVAAFSFLALTGCHEEKKELEPDYGKFPLGAVAVWDPELGEWVIQDDLGRFFGLVQQDKSGSRSTDYTISPVFDNQSKPCFYVINISDGGWMIISATKKFKPVLALSPTGYFDVDGTLPEGLEVWKENMIYMISNIDEVVPRDSIALYRSEWNRVSPCGYAEVRTDTTPDAYNYMTWGYGGRYDGYYINPYDDLPTLPNSAK